MSLMFADTPDLQVTIGKDGETHIEKFPFEKFP